MPQGVQLGHETRSPLVVPRSDGAVVNDNARHRATLASSAYSTAAGADAKCCPCADEEPALAESALSSARERRKPLNRLSRFALGFRLSFRRS
jgi:hypothetical protein